MVGQMNLSRTPSQILAGRSFNGHEPADSPTMAEALPSVN